MTETVLIEKRWDSSRMHGENYWMLTKNSDEFRSSYCILFDSSGEDDEWITRRASFRHEDFLMCIRELRQTNHAKITEKHDMIRFTIRDEKLEIQLEDVGSGSIVCTQIISHPSQFIALFGL